MYAMNPPTLTVKPEVLVVREILTQSNVATETCIRKTSQKNKVVMKISAFDIKQFISSFH